MRQVCVTIYSVSAPYIVMMSSYALWCVLPQSHLCLFVFCWPSVPCRQAEKQLLLPVCGACLACRGMAGCAHRHDCRLETRGALALLPIGCCVFLGCWICTTSPCRLQYVYSNSWMSLCRLCALVHMFAHCAGSKQLGYMLA